MKLQSLKINFQTKTKLTVNLLNSKRKHPKREGSMMNLEQKRLKNQSLLMRHLKLKKKPRKPKRMPSQQKKKPRKLRRTPLKQKKMLLSQNKNKLLKYLLNQSYQWSQLNVKLIQEWITLIDHHPSKNKTVEDLAKATKSEQVAEVASSSLPDIAESNSRASRLLMR